MEIKKVAFCFAILAGIVLLLNGASGVIYDVCEAMSGEQVSYDDFQVLIESIYNGECNEATNVKTAFSMSKDDFSELAYTYDIIDSEGNPLVFYRKGVPSPIGAGAILVYGNDGDFPVKMGDRLHIWTSGTPKDIMIELSIEGCDPYDDDCDAICSYEDDYVCDPLCYINNTRDGVQCDIDCVDRNNNHIIDRNDTDSICDPDCYNDDLDPKRAYDPDCVDIYKNDTICDPDSQGIRDGRCDPDCASPNHICDFDCNATVHPGNPYGYNDTDCYVCDGTCNGFCSFDCSYIDHDPDCPEGFTGWYELTECCGNNKCGIGETCLGCTVDCPPDNISATSPIEKNCSIFNLGLEDNYFCCPDAVNSDRYGCANLTINRAENDSCTCQPECGAGLECNGPADDMHCCKSGYEWNGTECIKASPTLDCNSINSPSDLPESWDWRNVDGINWMSPVKDQAQCGSCWAFSTLGALEGTYNIEQNDETLNADLAERYLVSTCCSAGTCGGGWPDDAFDYIRNSGVTDETCFPYVPSDSSCSNRCSDWSTRLWKIKSYTDVAGNSYTTKATFKSSLKGDTFNIKKRLTCQGPLSVASVNWKHAIVLVGYDNDNPICNSKYGTPGCWIIKNSWGVFTGKSYGVYHENGYGYIPYTGHSKSDIIDYVFSVEEAAPP